MPTEQSNTEAEIRALITRFADAAMRNDAEVFRTLWLPDGEWRIGEPFPFEARGVDAIVAAFSGLLSQWEFFAHLPHWSIVEARGGDRASARCCIEEIGLNAATGKSYHNIAFCFDDLCRVDGRWLFASRSYHYLWLDDRPVTGRAFPVPALPQDGHLT